MNSLYLIYSFYSFFSVEIPSYLLSAVLSLGIKKGQTYEWDALFKRFQNAQSITEQGVILRALAATHNMDLLERYNMSKNLFLNSLYALLQQSFYFSY